MKIMLKCSLVILVCMIYILFFAECNSSSGGYKSITVESELCRYSFVYPDYYELDGPRTNLDKTIPSTFLMLIAPEISETSEILDVNTGEIKTVIGYRSPAAISIDVYDPSKSKSAPQTAYERIENTLSSKASWANFKLLNRSPLTISGLEGEMIVYLVDRLMPIPVEDGKNLVYVCALYLDYDSLIWVIEAECDKEIMEQVKADLDYIINSFKIIR